MYGEDTVGDLSNEIVSFFFVFLSLSLAWAINPYINEFLMQKTPIYNTIQETCTNFVQSQGEEKAEYETDSTGDLIDGLKLPDLLRKNLEENNNAETYAALSVDTMTEYVSGYLARTVINGLSYVLAYIFIYDHDPAYRVCPESDRRTSGSQNSK